MAQKSSVTHVQERLKKTARPDALNSVLVVIFLTVLMDQMSSAMHAKSQKQNVKPNAQNSALVDTFSAVLMDQMSSATHVKSQKQNVKPNALN